MTDHQWLKCTLTETVELRAITDDHSSIQTPLTYFDFMPDSTGTLDPAP